MADVLVARVVTNTTPGSVAQVPVDALILTLSIPTNEFNDTLPVIPRESRVEQGKVLFRLKLKAHLVRRADNQAAANQSLRIKSSRANDQLHVDGQTNQTGDVFVILETREQGNLQLSCDVPGVALTPYQVQIGEAWYEAGFQVTHYRAYAESEFNGTLVTANGLNGQHRSDFLFSARGVAMQGTGLALDGRYVRFNGGGGGWHQNSHGHPDRLNNSETARFSYTDGVHGHYEVLTANHSIAVDPQIIPPRAAVNIESANGQRVVGERHAEDTGGMIHGAHIDNYSGEGADADAGWINAGGDLVNARIRFLRY